jgi:hypothetical protein
MAPNEASGDSTRTKRFGQQRLLGSLAARSRVRFSLKLRRSSRVAAVPTQNLRQIPATVLQHLVGGSAAFVVLSVDVGAVGDEKLDDLGAVLRVPVRIV